MTSALVAGRVAGLVAAVFILSGSFFLAAPAAAYPSLIRHGYSSCQACHVDPSGGGQLTAYGRAQSDLLVGWHLDPKATEGEPSPATGFLWGLLPPLPDAVNLSGNFRGGALYNETTNGGGAGLRPVLMATDLTATVDVEWFVAHVAVGFGLRNVGPAVVVSPNSGPDNALVSREHWAGVQLFDDALTIRAGRIPLPFGLRNVEHTSLVRSLTRTDINVHQQHGIAVSWNAESWRAEVMGIAGNFQIRPDEFRERGYSGFFEWAPAQNVAVGVSSLLTYAVKDLDASVPLLRQAHGAFARWAPAPWLVLLGEGDAIVRTSSSEAWGVGGVGWLQADIEPVQGVHIVPAVELAKLDETQAAPTMGGWLSFIWYPLPHAELRFDNIYTHVSPSGVDAVGNFTSLLQLHFFL